MGEVIRIPKLGLSDYAELASWEVAVGERVSKGAVVAVLESDKASAEIEAPADGVLLATYADEGEEIAVDVGRPLGVVGAEGETAPSLAEVEPDADLASDPGAGDDAGSSTQTSATTRVDSSSEEVKATPRAKRDAQERDVDLCAVEGTGPEGTVTAADVERHANVAVGSSEASGDDDLTVVESRELTGTRRTIAERLSRSAREKPHVMGTREIRIDRIEAVCDRLNGEYSVDVSLNDLLLYFVGKVLGDVPAFNARFEDGRHDLIGEVNVGYAVNGPRGLTVPVVERVTDRSLSELATERRELVQRVLDDEHAAEDLQGGTFTVTNVGVFGMDVSYSIINPPEVAILAIGRQKYAPVERNGDVEFGRVATFSLTIDHRVLDGADSGAFLERLAEYLQHPGAVLDDVTAD